MNGRIIELSFSDNKKKYIRRVKSISFKKETGLLEINLANDKNPFPYVGINTNDVISIMERYKKDGLIGFFKVTVIDASDVFEDSINNFLFLLPLNKRLSIKGFQSVIRDSFSLDNILVKDFYNCLPWAGIESLLRMPNGRLITSYKNEKIKEELYHV